ncbi:MAG: biotin transporter BioY [Defluviitaleaceae bacterium]|nr:biotin transporter BioY [Defluviitaleaceae bacterium]MCL2263851.1 biotin transporter BioY [Defluviitaleaceae bacterium]
MERQRIFTTRDLCYIGIFVAIIAVCAQISIPLAGGVPVTLQNWAVMLAGMILGGKKGAVAALVYILLGVAGVPVFTQFRGGIGVVLGATGGFIFSFPALAFMAGLGTKKRLALLLAGLVAGTVINLTSGMVWFAFVTQNTLQTAFAVALAPFILPEILKIVAVVIVGRSVQFSLQRMQVGL